MAFYELPQNKLIFPHPSLAEPDGLLAIGGDLSIKRLLLAYSHGIFPWFSKGNPILWWSPDPRLLLFPGEFKASGSLKRTLRQGIFQVTIDRAFDQVVEACAVVRRKDQEGTWITADMIQAYRRMHRKGYAHSVEAWHDEKLAGGLYGVSIGRVFFGESMFHYKSDASKVAFYHLIKKLEAADFRFVDAQVYTSHLHKMGAREIPREKYLELLEEAIHANPPGSDFWQINDQA